MSLGDWHFKSRFKYAAQKDLPKEKEWNKQIFLKYWGFVAAGALMPGPIFMSLENRTKCGICGRSKVGSE